MIRHSMQTYRPYCDISCTAEGYYNYMLSKTSPEKKKKGIQELNFIKKQMDNTYEVVKNYDKLAQNKLLTKGADSCSVMQFEDIGT